MRHHRLAAALVAVLLTSAAAAATQAAPNKGVSPMLSGSIDLLTLDREVRDLLSPVHGKSGRFCRGRLKDLLPITARSDFERLPVDTRRAVLATVAACDDTVLRRPEVLALVRRLEPLADTPTLIAAVNAALIDGETAEERPVEAGRRLLKVLENDPKLPAHWWEAYISPVLDGSMADDEVYREIVRRLQTVEWTEETSAAAARNNWALRRADQLIEDGDLKGAEKMLARADQFDTLVLVAQEKPYAKLWPKFEAAGRFDWTRVVETELVYRRKLTEEYPDSLRMGLGVQRLLRMLQRYDEAVAYGQGLRGRLKADEAFSDRDGYAGQMLSELAYALLDTGKVAEAETVFREAIGEGEYDDDGVGQKLDWASRLNGMGRHAEALALIADIGPDDVSAYCAMWLSAERVCALSKTDAARAWSYLPKMLFSQADGPEPMQKALLCLDRADEAAALYIQRIKDPDRRSDAMGAARIVRRPPSVGPFDAELMRRRDAVLARPDVKAAFAEHGRVLDLPLSGTLFGWY